MEEAERQHQPEKNVLSSSSVAYASSSATIVTKTILHPLDTIKCRLQSSISQKWWHVWREYRGKWGPTYLYSGLPIKLAFYVPYQSIYMTSYTAAQETLRPANVHTESRITFLARTIVAACTADLVSSVVRVPMEAVKMRIQSNTVPNTIAALQQLSRHGFIACARLVVPQTLLHDVPYSAIQWVLYESLRPCSLQVLQHHGLEAEPHNVSRFYLCTNQFIRTFLTGGFSGFIASILTVPLDTIRTRVVVITAANPTATVCGVVRDTYRMGGVRLFFRGASARVLWVTTNMALYFPLYEGFKSVLLRVPPTAAVPSSP